MADRRGTDTGPRPGRRGHVALAYVTTGYPQMSHTFIQREVLGLRALGATVATFTVQEAAPEQILSARDAEEFRDTYAIRPVKPMHFLGAHLRALATRPRLWARALTSAVSSAGLDPRAALWQLFYFVQGVVLWDRVRRSGARHIHAHFANVASDLAMTAASIGGAGWTWSFTMHGPREFFDVAQFGLARKATKADFVICISNFSRSQLMAFTDESQWDKLEIVHCAVDGEQFDLVPRAAAGPADGLRILFIGRLVPVKGVSLLLGALADVRAGGVAASLTIVGDGPSRGELERQVRELALEAAVGFAGPVGQDDIGGYLEDSDVLALTSFAEGVPVVLMEAMACGLPVLASRVAGVAELVEHGRSGLLVTPGAREEAADAIRSLAAMTPERRAEMGLAGRDRVLAEFETRGASARLLDIFQTRAG